MNDIYSQFGNVELAENTIITYQINKTLKPDFKSFDDYALNYDVLKKAIQLHPIMLKYVDNQNKELCDIAITYCTLNEINIIVPYIQSEFLTDTMLKAISKRKLMGK